MLYFQKYICFWEEIPLSYSCCHLGSASMMTSYVNSWGNSDQIVTDNPGAMCFERFGTMVGSSGKSSVIAGGGRCGVCVIY